MCTRLQNFVRMYAFGNELGTIETRLRGGFAQFFLVKTVDTLAQMYTFSTINTPNGGPVNTWQACHNRGEWGSER